MFVVNEVLYKMTFDQSPKLKTEGGENWVAQLKTEWQNDEFSGGLDKKWASLLAMGPILFKTYEKMHWVRSIAMMSVRTTILTSENTESPLIINLLPPGGL